MTSNIIKSINECFGLIKYIRLRNKENFFFSRFNHSVLRLNKLNRNLSFIREIPKNILEIIAISSLSFVVLINFDSTNGVSKNLISLLAIYAGAAFRILPAINRIINLVQAFYNYIPTLDILYHDLVSKKIRSFLVLQSMIINFNLRMLLNLKTFTLNMISKRITLLKILV